MEKYRTEKRKANIGERIVITNPSEGADYYPGEVFTVESLLHRKGKTWTLTYEIYPYLSEDEYEVIVNESIKEANEMTTKPLTDYSYEELLEAIKAKAVWDAKTPAEKLSEGLQKAFANFKFEIPTIKTPQKQRDQIVEQAKRDVAELAAQGSVQIDGYYVGGKPRCTIEYVVNNNKRTIVVLLRGVNTKRVRAKGIAKCDPSDCFNAHIGKAIALRRALGLEVPTEYLNAPHPTEVRVGDVVKSISKLDKFYTVREDRNRRNSSTDCALSSIVAKHGRIIDDSREGE